MLHGCWQTFSDCTAASTICLFVVNMVNGEVAFFLTFLYWVSIFFLLCFYVKHRIITTLCRKRGCYLLCLKSKWIRLQCLQTHYTLNYKVSKHDTAIQDKQFLNCPLSVFVKTDCLCEKVSVKTKKQLQKTVFPGGHCYVPLVITPTKTSAFIVSHRSATNHKFSNQFAMRSKM